MTPVPEPLTAALGDRYRIERELGRGGNAVVYLAHDRKHDRQVALKVLIPELALAVRAERFLREIQIAAKLTHPHILALYDSGQVDQFLYYVMPHVPGESLRDRLTREKQLPVEDALRITREVAAALDYAHRQGVVHRDIKPENILLSEGEAVVADFGIARALTVAAGQSVTATGVAVGTPAYMSPEQSGGGEPDGRADVYSLGCVLYEMLVGHPPYLGTTAQEVLARHALDTVPSVLAARPDVSQAVETIVARALAKVPVARFATAAQFARALTAPGVATRSRQGALVYAVLMLVILLGGAGIAYRNFRPSRGAAPPEKSIAVLPFVNLSTDSAQGYFSDGMTDELTNALTRFPGLHVTARTSAFAFKGKNVDIREIGRQLGVTRVVQGMVRRAGGQLRITAQLINVADGYHLWSETYDRSLALADVLAVQDELSRAIIEALQIKLAVYTPTPPRNLEAYELYLKGRLLWDRGGDEQALTQALDFFTAAIDKDSGYARAWAGAADVYRSLPALRYLSQAEAYPKAREAAERAVALDSLLPEAYGARGALRAAEWDWSGAELDYRRAIALDPGQPRGTQGYGNLLVRRGRFAEGIRLTRRAAELDPLSARALYNYAINLLYAGQYAAAMEQSRKALQLEPNAQGHQQLAQIYLVQRRFADAIREFQTALEMLGGRGRSSANIAQLGYTYARAGQRQKAVEILNELTDRAARGDSITTRAVHFAVLHAGLGEKNQALRWLAQAVDERDPVMNLLRVYPFFDPLRADPRFDELVKRVGL